MTPLNRRKALKYKYIYIYLDLIKYNKARYQYDHYMIVQSEICIQIHCCYLSYYSLFKNKTLLEYYVESMNATSRDLPYMTPSTSVES